MVPPGLFVNVRTLCFNPSMNEKMRKIFYVNVYGLPLFAERVAQQPHLSLRGITADTDAATVREILAESHVYHVSSGGNDMAPEYHVHAKFLDRTPNLLMVSTIGAGYDPVDVKACTDRGVVAVHQSGGASAQAVAEHTLAMMLGLGKRIGEAGLAMRRVPNLLRGRYTGRNMHGKTVGLIGFGHVGQRLARVCRHGFDMRVLVVSEYFEQGGGAQSGASQTDLPTLLREADYVVVCCALSDRTKGMIGESEFALMQPHAYFVTTARAGIHDEAALLEALRGKVIAGAGIDVWDIEPPAIDHPLLQLDNVLATPHTAGATRESRSGTSESAVRQILQALGGQRPERLLNPEVWPRFMQRLRQAFPDFEDWQQAATDTCSGTER